MRKWIAALALALSAPVAQAADYTIDPEHSFPTFEIDHLGYSMYRGRFDKATGTFSYDAAAKSGSADVTIDVASVDTGVAKLDDHLKTKDFFDAAEYPTIAFKSTKFRFEGEKVTAVDGDLTLHGQTKPVTLTVTRVACKPHPVTKEPRCGADAEAKIKRSDFGMTNFLPLVGDEVTLRLQIEGNEKKQ
jgi:polyisoprenoid-binding protein YceI